jgi:hypothetical protein
VSKEKCITDRKTLRDGDGDDGDGDDGDGDDEQGLRSNSANEKKSLLETVNSDSSPAAVVVLIAGIQKCQQKISHISVKGWMRERYILEV